MTSISEQFEHIFEVVSSEGFLKMQALGGEIPFYISAYDPTQEMPVRQAIRGLINKLEKRSISVLEVNLYDLSVEIIDNKMGMEKMFKVEQRRKDKAKFMRALQSSLNMHEVLMPAVEAKIKQAQAQVYFFTGIGEVFPFIRSHNVLNNLQNIAKQAPTVMFFPGNYNGHSLELFGKLTDDNYYRAFNIQNV
ncbi:DUF1788 domain-containing protein [Persicobacter psychrovividus]